MEQTAQSAEQIQAERYGKIAYETYNRLRWPNFINLWDELTDEERGFWIGSANAVGELVLADLSTAEQQSE